MATKGNEPKQTNQAGEGRKDEQKGVKPGRDVEDQSNIGSTQGNDSGDQTGNNEAKGGRNSQGGEWGKNKGKGGDDSHNRR